MNKKIAQLEQQKYVNSGIYDRPFYEEQVIWEENPELAEARLVESPEKWRLENEEAEYLECWEPMSREYEKAAVVRFNRSCFYNDSKLQQEFYEPLIFDIKIALECRLIPFYYQKRQCIDSPHILSLLAAKGNKHEFNFKLDAYQVLTHGTVDEKSTFALNKSYYEEILGKAIVDKMETILNLQSANNYFNSGIYNRPFYEKEYIYYPSNYSMRQKNSFGICYNKNLLVKAWQVGGDTKDELYKMVKEKFWYNLELGGPYYQPQVFDEKIALECGLTPFSYPHPKYEGDWADIELLALSGGTDKLKPRLDAYQVLSTGTIDEQSLFFHDKEAFEKILGVAVVARMEDIIKYQAIT